MGIQNQLDSFNSKLKMKILTAIALLGLVSACTMDCVKNQGSAEEVKTKCEGCDAVLGCNFQCAILCSKFAEATKLDSCATRCGCSALVAAADSEPFRETEQAPAS
jgi:hypothetical protein